MVNIVVADTQVMPSDVMFSAQLHTHLKQGHTRIVITESHRQSAQVKIHIFRGREWIEVISNMHDIFLKIALHFVACIGNVVDQYLLELVEDLTLVAAEANEGENVL